VVTAGDQAVAFKDTKAAMALIEFLASPEAASIMAAGGGYLSANKNLQPSAYPDATMQALAKSVVNACTCRKPRPGWSGGMFVFVQEAAETVTATDA
jgi:ABC-type glycerol-3-phosphate transport system substrate-binding protein